MTTDVKAILDSIADEEYGNTEQTAIKHTFKYKSQSGFLEGRKAAEDGVQEISVTLLAGQKEANIKEIQILLGAILERHAIFGPLYQYPKILVLGPGAFSKVISEGVSGVKSPYIRDVDRIIWIKHGSSDELFDWGVIDLFHNYRNPVSSVKIKSHYYSNYSNQAQNDELAKQIVKGFFQDGNDFDFVFTFEMRSDLGYLDHFGIMWFLQRLAIERSPNYSDLLKDSKGKVNLTKKMALLGTIPFVVPKTKNQGEHPVPIGALKLDRLVSISDTINEAPQINLQSTSMINSDSGSDIEETNFFSSSDEPQDSSDDLKDWDAWN